MQVWTCRNWATLQPQSVFRGTFFRALPGRVSLQFPLSGDSRMVQPVTFAFLLKVPFKLRLSVWRRCSCMGEIGPQFVNLHVFGENRHSCTVQC